MDVSVWTVVKPVSLFAPASPGECDWSWLAQILSLLGENGLDGWTQRQVGNGITSSWPLVTGGTPQSSDLAPALLHVFTDDPDK